MFKKILNRTVSIVPPPIPMLVQKPAKNPKNSFIIFLIYYLKKNRLIDEYNKNAINIIFNDLSEILSNNILPNKPPIEPPMAQIIPNSKSTKFLLLYIIKLDRIIGNIQNIVIARESFSDILKNLEKTINATIPPPDENNPLTKPISKPRKIFLNSIVRILYLKTH